MKEEFRKIAQSYLGMTPNDKGCINWSEMQDKMANELDSAVKRLSPNITLAGSLPLSKLNEKVEHLIKWNRKMCWEAEFENGNFCIGENKLREFVKELKQ